MAAYEQVLRGGVGLFDASQSVQRDEWHAYVQALRVADNYPGILGIGYGPLIPARERDGYIQGMRADGLADYRIWPEGERSEYAPVMYLERFEGPNPRVFGYDMMSEPKRSAAMRRAAESGTAALTGLVKLAAGADNQPIGLLMYLPVYRHGLFLAEGSGGRAAPLGFVYATFRLPTLMQAILGDYKRDFALALRDGDSPSDASVMFESGDLAAETPFTQAQDIHLYGRTWTLHVATLPGFQAGIGHWKSRAVLVAGSALSLMLGALHPVGAGDAGAVHQGVDDHGQGIGRGGLEPEAGEARELLGRRQARIDGDAAGGEAVLIELAGAAEIGGAEEGEPIRLAAGIHDTEAGEADVLGQLGRELRLAEGEERRRVQDFARLAVLHDMELHRRLEEAAEMEELDRIGPVVVVRPQRVARNEADLLVGVVVDALEHVAVADRRRLVGLGRQLLGLPAQPIETERLRLAQGKAGAGGGVRPQRERDERQGTGADKNAAARNGRMDSCS